MQTYCLSCWKYTNNIGSKKIIMTNKVIRENSRCPNCIAAGSRFLREIFIKKTGWDKINLKLFIY